MPRTTKRRAVRWSIVAALAAIALLALTFSNFASGGGTSKAASQRLAAAPDYTQLLLETTTSVRDSGLMDKVVVPAWQARYPDVTIKYVAVGSGQALADAAAGGGVAIHSVLTAADRSKDPAIRAMVSAARVTHERTERAL